MKLAGLQLPDRELPRPLRALGLRKDSIVGYSSLGRIVVGHAGLARPLEFTLGIDCRRPDQYGSIAVDTRRLRAALKRGEKRLGHVCPARYGSILRGSPDGENVGYLDRGSPVAIQSRSPSGKWTRVVNDGVISHTGAMSPSTASRGRGRRPCSERRSRVAA